MGCYSRYCRGVFYASGSVSRVLSWTTIYLALPLPAGSSHLLRTTGPVICPPTVLLRIEFTASTCLHAMSELLPHFSTLTGTESTGGISLLHLSEGYPWRALPVILALWSPDFPHAQAFALCPRPSDPLAGLILPCSRHKSTIILVLPGKKSYNMYLVKRM